MTTLLPGTLGGEQRRWTDAQATGAWGDPGAPTRIILACGVAVPGPTTLPCQPVDGVDWIIDDTDAPSYLVTTYGRSPAVQVYLDTEFVSSMDVLSALSGIVNALPRTGAACVDLPIEEG